LSNVISDQYLRLNPSSIHGLKEAAYEYYKQGLNIVLLQGKTPLHEWSRWRTERQSREDFDNLPWDKADGFALIGGLRLDNGLYIAIIDYDVKNVGEEAKDRGRRILEKLPATYMEETPSGGLHLFYLSRVKPRTVSRYHDGCALELLGDGKLCIMAPSLGYRPLNDGQWLILEDVEGVFYEAIGVEDERARVNKGFSNLDKGLLEKWRDQILGSGRLKQAGSGDRWLLFHCPFHPPDIHPSFGFNTEKFYFIDFHDGKCYNLKEMAEALRIELEGSNRSLEPEARLGDYKLKAIGGDVFLLDKNEKPVSTWKLYQLNFKATKQKLMNVTGQRIEEVGRAAAAFLYQARAGQWLKPEKGKATPSIEDNSIDEEVEKLIDEEVQRILEAENQLEALKPNLDNIIVGEDPVKRVVLVLLTSSKFPEPGYKQIILLKGTEGGGKSTIASALTSAFKTKEVGRFTEHALDYSDLSSHEVLYIKELGYMDEDRQGVGSIRFLSSDDRGYTVEYTVRDPPPGRFRTEQRHIPAITMISTTTRLDVDRQFERRIWFFNVDESEVQTRRVLEWKARLSRQRDEIKMGLRKITDYDFSLKVVRRFISAFKPERVVIPFRESLAKILKTKHLRVRGDIDKLYCFIELYAHFNLKRLLKTGDGVYIVTPEVAVEALEMIDEAMANMLGGVDERIKPLLQLLEKMEVEGKLGLGSTIGKEERERMAVDLGISERTVRRLLNHLERQGFLSSDEKKPKTYRLLYPVGEMERKSWTILDNIGSSKDLRIFLENDFKKSPFYILDRDRRGDIGDAEDTPRIPLGGTVPNPEITLKQDDSYEKTLEDRTVQSCPSRSNNLGEIIPEEPIPENLQKVPVNEPSIIEEAIDEDWTAKKPIEPLTPRKDQSQSLAWDPGGRDPHASLKLEDPTAGTTLLSVRATAPSSSAEPKAEGETGFSDEKFRGEWEAKLRMLRAAPCVDQATLDRFTMRADGPMEDGRLGGRGRGGVGNGYHFKPPGGDSTRRSSLRRASTSISGGGGGSCSTSTP